MTDDHRDLAASDIEIANKQSSDASADYFIHRAIASALVALVDRLDRIDDALRNTIGGMPR